MNWEEYGLRLCLSRGELEDYWEGYHVETKEKVLILTVEGAKLSFIEAGRFKANQEFALRLQHPNFLKLKKLEKTNNGSSIHLIFEYPLNVVTLKKHIASRPNKCLSEYEARILFKQIAEALQECHRHNLVFKKLNVWNIWVLPNNQVKLGDFLISSQYGPSLKYHSNSHTLPFCPPELRYWSEGKEITKASDIWSLGAILFFMIFGQYPFGNKDQPEGASEFFIMTQNLLEDASLELQNLLLQMFVLNPKLRPTIDQVLCHPWLTESMSIATTINSLPLRTSPGYEQTLPFQEPKLHESFSLSKIGAVADFALEKFGNETEEEFQRRKQNFVSRKRSMPTVMMIAPYQNWNPNRRRSSDSFIETSPKMSPHESADRPQRKMAKKDFSVDPFEEPLDIAPLPKPKASSDKPLSPLQLLHPQLYRSLTTLAPLQPTPPRQQFPPPPIKSMWEFLPVLEAAGNQYFQTVPPELVSRAIQNVASEEEKSPLPVPPSTPSTSSPPPLLSSSPPEEEPFDPRLQAFLDEKFESSFLEEKK